MIVDNLTGIFRRIFAGVLGTADRRHLPRRVPDPARLGAARGPGWSPSPTSPRCSATTPPASGSPPGSATRSCATSGPGTRSCPPHRGRRAVGPLMNKLRAFLLRQFAQRRDRRRPVHLRHGRRPRQRRAVPGPAAQGHPRRGDRAARRLVHRRPDLAGRRPPRPAARGTPARTPACTSTSARTSSTCPTRWKTCSPRPAPTGSPSPWPTRTSPSSPRTCARASARTPAPRSSSPSAPRTPATWNATPPRC